MAFVIAVVDDDSGYRDALQWLLKSSGYEIHCYDSVAAFVNGHDPSDLGCLLLDLRLGEENGIEAMKQARLGGFDAPAILVSAYGSVPLAVLAMQMGAFDFVEKPCDNHQLLAVVARACEEHHAIRQSHGLAIDAIRKYQRLTEREKDIFWLLAGGMTTKTLAAKLSISVRTAEAHRGRVSEKMEARSIGDLLSSAFHLGKAYK